MSEPFGEGVITVRFNDWISRGEVVAIIHLGRLDVGRLQVPLNAWPAFREALEAKGITVSGPCFN